MALSSNNSSGDVRASSRRKGDGCGTALSLNAAERAFLDTPLAASPLRPLLKRLLPYFRGRHTTDEVMWRENLQRSDLQSLMAAFADVLVEVYHELPEELV